MFYCDVDASNLSQTRLGTLWEGRLMDPRSVNATEGQSHCQGFTHNPMQTVLNRPDWTYLNVSLTFVGTVREHRPGSGCKTQTDQRWTSLHVNTSERLTVNKHNLAWKLFTRFHTHLFLRRRVITIVHEAANQWESMGSTAVRQRAPQGRINTRDDAFTGIFTGNIDAVCLFEWRD